MRLGRAIARMTIGGLFVGHGTQKLFGWFGGPGLDGTTGMMEKLELRPARPNAVASGSAEAAGGALLVLGALMPVAGALLSASMITAIRKVHLPNGVWSQAGGYEYNVVVLAAVLALVEQKEGLGKAVGALAAGAAGSTVAIEVGGRQAAAG